MKSIGFKYRCHILPVAKSRLFMAFTVTWIFKSHESKGPSDINEKKHANWTGMETISIFIKYNFRSRVLYFQRHETCGLALLFIHATKVNQPTKLNLSQAITSNVILPRCHGFVVDVIGLLKYFEVGHFSSGFGGKNRKNTKTIGILKEIATFSWKHFSIAGAAFANFPSPISIISLTHSFQSNLSICQKYGWAHWHLLYFVTVSRINLNYFRFISIFLVGGWLLVRVFMFFFSSWQKLLYKQKFISKKRLSVGTKTKMRIAGLFRVFTMHLQQINRFSFHVILSDWLCIAMSMLRYGSPSPLHTHISFYLAHFINATQFPNFHTKLTAPYYFITFSIFQSEE